ncbi:oxidoreductase [Kribbia dieselivorans]|uniref:oxidoreductase n=1 Tax=Kribbia dieselivorans TaxID=331526 RepID=UPI000A6FA721|nr:oxidoreductase [Kribbia dieselivorans]
MFGVDDIPDLTGRVAVVTGANGGLGLQTTRVLAAKGAHVVMAARNEGKTERAVEEVRRETPQARLTTIRLDLGSLDSVREAAEAIVDVAPRIDLLINNAGVMATPEGRTADGFETQLGVDHLGHWALTARLLPELVAAPAARVVTVTSFARFSGRPLDSSNPHLRGRYSAWPAYGQAKLANYHFGLGLQGVFVRAGARAASLIAHPGLSHTDLQPQTVRLGGAGQSAGFWAWSARVAGMPPERGAMPQLRAATDPGARGGELYGPRFGTFGPAVRRPILRRNAAAIRTLWEVSERETGLAVGL